MPITEKQTVCVNSGFAHPADTTKQVQFDMSGITASSPAVVTVPDASGTMALVTEGTYSPTLIGSTAAGTTTYTTQIGRYTQIANTVWFELYLVVNTTSGATGSLLATLPFAAANIAGYYPSFSVGYVANLAGTGWASFEHQALLSAPNTANISLWTAGASSYAQTSTSALQATTSIAISGHYRIA